MRAYVDMIHRTREPVVRPPHFGMADGGGFVLGAQAWQCGPDAGVTATPVELARTAASMARLFKPAGSLEAWKQAANLYARPGQEPMAFALFTGFGAPLLRLTDAPGFLVHLAGPSGSGKRAALNTTAAIWGNPRWLVTFAPAAKKIGPTHNVLIAQLGTLHHLPLMFDTITAGRDDDVMSLVQALVSGQEKDRMTASLDVLHGLRWKSIYLSSAIGSLRAMAGHRTGDVRAAMQDRLLEVHLPPPDPRDRTWIDDECVAALAKENYGHAGQRFVQWMIRNETQLPAMIRERQATLMRRYCARRDESGKFAVIAAILVGAELAQAAGLHDIDVTRVERWVMRTLLSGERMGIAAARQEPGDLLGEFMKDHLVNMLVVTRSRMPDKRDADKEQTGYVLRQPVRGCPLLARYEVGRGALFIPCEVLRSWCENRHVDFQHMKDDLKKRGMLVKEACVCKLARGHGPKAAKPHGCVKCVRLHVPATMLGLENCCAADDAIM